MLEFKRKALDETLLESILSAAEGAPLETFREIVTEKLSERSVRATFRSGLLINLAGDAAKSWKARQRQTEAIERRTRNQCPRCYGSGRHPNFHGEFCPDCKGTGKKTE